MSAGEGRVGGREEGLQWGHTTNAGCHRGEWGVKQEVTK